MHQRAHGFLCLRCRGQGHLLRDCPSPDWPSEFSWMFSETRMQLDFESAWTESDHKACPRCQGLDLIRMLDEFPPWTSQKEQEDAVSQRSNSIRHLGKTGEIEFWTDCHVCRCLFAMTPNPSSFEQDVLLIPDWTLCRVTGEFGVVFDKPEQRHYATCLVVALDPSSVSVPLAIHAHRGDAMCLIAEDVKDSRTLGGRRLVRSKGPNIEMVEEWINRCATLHGADCAPVLTEELAQIRLLDVQTRRIVPFPEAYCEYVALSYVWGGIPAKSYKAGDQISSAPKTLEDAIVFTKALGKRYLWTDYVCIEQSNEQDKADQIARMWSIYRGAHVTVIALSGNSAEAGLSGFSRTSHVPQLTCCIQGRRLVGTMPTFSQQAWVVPWSQRAWTLQEAYLSPRCLYFSDHQMYFDCTAMLCCESLDHSRSWAHNLTPASNPTDRGFLTWVTDQIGAGGYRIPLRDPAKRLENWGVKLNMYSYRHMTYDEDAERAFEGIAQQLRTAYPRGFFYGLPIEDFDWGLVWRSQWPPTRRQGFPSWTWTGWKGGLWFGQPFDVTQTRQFCVQLDVRSVQDGRLETVFRTEFVPVAAVNDPVSQAAERPPKRNLLRPDQLSMAEKNGILVIDAVCFDFSPDFSNPRTHTQQSGQFEIFDVVIQGTACLIRIISVDKIISRPIESGSESFVLIARDSINGLISHHLLMVRAEQASNSAVRITTLELLVPQNRLMALEALKPQRRSFLLA